MADIGISEQSIELIRAIYIIIVFEHRDKKALPEPAGAEEKQIGRTHVLDQFDMLSFIDKIIILRFYFIKTAYAIRYLFHIFHS